jgi:hypothetical protein
MSPKTIKIPSILLEIHHFPFETWFFSLEMAQSALETHSLALTHIRAPLEGFYSAFENDNFVLEVFRGQTKRSHQKKHGEKEREESELK